MPVLCESEPVFQVELQCVVHMQVTWLEDSALEEQGG